MREDIKQKIEKLVLQDIDYILNYKPIAKGAESAQYFSNMNIIKPIALNVYPQIYVDLVKRFEKDEAIRRLRNLGYRVAKFYYCSFPDELKKPLKFSKIFSEVGKKHMDEKVSIKDIIKIYKKLKSCVIEIEHCIFCSDITPFENLEIPFCIAKTAFYESLYNIKSLYNRDMSPRLVQVDAIRSARFDGDFCEYKLIVID